MKASTTKRKKADLAAVLEPEDVMSGIKKEFDKVKKTPLTRKVTLKTDCWCGMGCNNARVTREVPYDSSLKDGDHIKNSEIKNSDKTFNAIDK